MAKQGRAAGPAQGVRELIGAVRAQDSDRAKSREPFQRWHAAFAAWNSRQLDLRLGWTAAASAEWLLGFVELCRTAEQLAAKLPELDADDTSGLTTTPLANLRKHVEGHLNSDYQPTAIAAALLQHAIKGARTRLLSDLRAVHDAGERITVPVTDALEAIARQSASFRQAESTRPEAASQKRFASLELMKRAEDPTRRVSIKDRRCVLMQLHSEGMTSHAKKRDWWNERNETGQFLAGTKGREAVKKLIERGSQMEEKLRIVPGDV